MIENDLLQLSFEQLEEIKSRVSQIILNKRSARISSAIKDVLCLLNTHYPDVNLWDFLNELADVYQECDLTEISVAVDLEKNDDLQHEGKNSQTTNDYMAPTTANPFKDVVNHQQFSETPQIQSEPSVNLPLDTASLLNQQHDVLLLQDPDAFYERLKTIRSEILQHENARLLWLTNDGSQKTSRVSGKALADLLQETLKKLDRLCDSETELDIETLNREVLRISEWSEFHLGVSLRKGTLTVITPFATRELASSGQPSMLTIADMQKQAGNGDVHIPFSYHR
ncbi:hypothetical protein GFS31_07290 [Leptolyngbya sp. BL0902]|nr:hypothetical protein GFS31_07290 [Leptolyngbya sp. BL0902]